MATTKNATVTVKKMKKDTVDLITQKLKLLRQNQALTNTWEKTMDTMITVIRIAPNTVNIEVVMAVLKNLLHTTI